MIPNYVTIRRRALPRNLTEELRFGGQILEPAPSPVDATLALPEDVARWMFSGERFMVHTTAGEWVHRFGIESASNQFLEQLGRPEVLDTSAIEIDTKRLETWNTDAVGLSPDRATVTQFNVPAPRDRQPAAPFVVGR